MAVISIHQLERTLLAAFVDAGVPELSAKATTQALVRAEAEGIASHGLIRVGSYLAQLRSGKIRCVAPEVDLRPGLVRVDAGFGLAHAAIALGLEQARECLREVPLVLVTVGRSHHAGVLGHAVESAARSGCIALGFANTPAAIAPWGGAQALYGTNPIAFATPRSDSREPLVIDLSVSVVARGRILAARQRGESIPDDWALDAQGRPTTDPQAALGGSMRPMADAKGANLALMVELLAGALTASRFGHEASSFLDAEGEPPSVGQSFLLIDPQRVAADYLARVEVLLAAVLEQPGVRLPGERRRENRRLAERDGVSIRDGLWAEIQAFAAG